MATFNNGESGSSVRAKINAVLQHADGTAGEIVFNDAGADVDFRIESDTNANAFFLDGATGNLGLGVTPSAWASSVRALETTTGAFYSFASGSVSNFYMMSNSFVNSGGTPTYKQSAAAAQYLQTAGQHQWYTAPSGTAGNPITFTQVMTLNASGNLGIGTSSPASSLDVASAASDAVASLTATGVQRWQLKTERSTGNFLVYNQTGTSTPITLTNTGNLGIGESSPDYRLDVNGAIGFTPGSSVTPVDNGDVVFELTNNTTLTVKARGSDGVVRSATITLA